MEVLFLFRQATTNGAAVRDSAQAAPPRDEELDLDVVHERVAGRVERSGQASAIDPAFEAE